MNKNDLKKDDYYYAEYRNKSMRGFCIVKGKQNTYRPNLYTGNNEFYMKNCCNADVNIRLATPKEKHWLNKCIELDKFITKEEAMKDFIPEYVKHVDYSDDPVGKIYDTKVSPTWNTGLTWKQIFLMFNRLNDGSFTISTKEEFEAQNKPKEIMRKITTTINKLKYDGSIDIPKGTTFKVFKEYPNSYQVINPNNTVFNLEDEYLFLHKCYFEQQNNDFILSEKWCIKRDNENWKIITDYLNSNYGRTYMYDNPVYPYVSNCRTFNDSRSSVHSNHQLITFEQFKKYVLKEESKEESSREVTVKLDSRVYSLDEITKVINANYEKEDALEIIKTIKTIK